jgi:hypothetical protein
VGLDHTTISCQLEGLVLAHTSQAGRYCRVGYFVLCLNKNVLADTWRRWKDSAKKSRIVVV